MLTVASKMRLTMLISLLAISLSACSTLRLHGNSSQSTTIEHWVKGETTPHEEVTMLLNQFKVLDGLPAKQLKSEYRTAERMFRKQPTMVTRLQLAWLLAMQDTGFQDIPRALRLLDIKKNNIGSEQPPKVLDDLAHLIRHTVQERKLQQDKYRRTVKALDAERKTSEELATKIKDLTQIEESMIQRKPLPETEIR